MKLHLYIITSQFTVTGIMDIPVNKDEVKDFSEHEIVIDYLSKYRRKTDFIPLTKWRIIRTRDWENKDMNPASQVLSIRKEEIVAFSVIRDNL